MATESDKPATEPKKRTWKSFFMKTRTPWREYSDLKGGWSKGYDKTLLAGIKKEVKQWYNDHPKSGKINIMMLGQVQSGKSSTINTLFSILQGQLSVRTKAGVSDSSFTRKFQDYEGIHELSKIVFYDIMGLELAPDHVMTPDKITLCVKGHVQSGTVFKDDKSNTENDHQVSLNDMGLTQNQMHCIVYCVDAELIFNETIPGLQKKIKSVEDALKIEDQDRIVLVTKIDNICEEVRKDIREIFYSKNVLKAVENASKIFGVPLNQVFPVKNYTTEMELDPYKNVPILLAIQKAVHYGLDFLRGISSTSGSQKTAKSESEG